MSDLEMGKLGVISGVVNHSSLFLQHLNKCDLTLGKFVRIIEINAFDLSVQLEIDNKNTVHISNEVARNILIKTK